MNPIVAESEFWKFLVGGERLTSWISRIKIIVVGLLPRGSGRHDKGKNPVNCYGSGKRRLVFKVLKEKPTMCRANLPRLSRARLMRFLPAILVILIVAPRLARPKRVRTRNPQTRRSGPRPKSSSRRSMPPTPRRSASLGAGCRVHRRVRAVIPRSRSDRKGIRRLVQRASWRDHDRHHRVDTLPGARHRR